MKKVFISHPFKDNPTENRKEVKRICKELVKSSEVLPVSPLHLFSFMEEEDKNIRPQIMKICYKLINICDEVWVYGDSEGCNLEKKYALKHDKKVVIKY